MLSRQVTTKNKTPPLSNKAPQIIKPKFIWLSDRSKIPKWVIPCSFYYKQCKQFVLTARTIAGWSSLSKVNLWYRTDSFCSCHILFGIYNIYFEIKLTWASSITTIFKVMKTHFLSPKTERLIFYDIYMVIFTKNQFLFTFRYLYIHTCCYFPFCFQSLTGNTVIVTWFLALARKIVPRGPVFMQSSFIQWCKTSHCHKVIKMISTWEPDTQNRIMQQIFSIYSKLGPIYKFS